MATWFSVARTDGVLLKALVVGRDETIDGITALGAAIGTAGLHTAGVRKRRSIVARIVWMWSCVWTASLEALGDFLVWYLHYERLGSSAELAI